MYRINSSRRLFWSYLLSLEGKNITIVKVYTRSKDRTGEKHDLLLIQVNVFLET